MLQVIVDRLVYGIFGLHPDSRFTGVVHFFIYDSAKILLLLFAMIWVIGFVRTFLSPYKMKQWVKGKGVFGNLFASIFGAVTPFCSCSSIPLFLSFISAGIPLGIAFSFLITSPIINEYLVVLMIGFFGWKITALYVLSGILIGVVSGLVLGKMKLEKYLVKDLVPRAEESLKEAEEKSFGGRIKFGFGEAKSIVGKLWLWILAGVLIGSVIHNYIPQETVQSIIGKTGFFSVPIATLLGVPMYANCAAIVPIAVVLFQKGVPLGTALSFMMATAALSLPEAVMLRRAMKLQLIAIFFGITTLAIIFTGYLFNFMA